jgi:hypothetical protein
MALLKLVFAMHLNIYNKQSFPLTVYFSEVNSLWFCFFKDSLDSIACRAIFYISINTSKPNVIFNRKRIQIIFIV